MNILECGLKTRESPEHSSEASPAQDLLFSRNTQTNRNKYDFFINCCSTLMDVKHLNITLNPRESPEEAYQVVKHVRFDWKLSDVRFKIFTEGFTNKLIGVYNINEPNDIVLVRIYGDKTDLFINRQDEIRNFKLMYARGYAPRLYLTFVNGMVYEYLPGIVLTDDLCRNCSIYPLIAEMMAKLHKLSYDESIPKVSRMWEKMSQFIDLIPERFSNAEKQSRFSQYFTGGRNTLRNDVLKLKQTLQLVDSPVVFCHNDLLLANVIYNEEKHTVAFIDYEYANYNYQAFDIANHFAEFAGVTDFNPVLYPNEQFQRNWIREYSREYAKTTDEDHVKKLCESVRQFAAAPHLFWCLWSFLQAEHSHIDFDYLQYGILRYEEFKRLLRSINGIS